MEKSREVSQEIVNGVILVTEIVEYIGSLKDKFEARTVATFMKTMAYVIEQELEKE